MSHRIVVWGTGNVGRPALRSVLAHRDLELADVVVANPDKTGRDAGELCGLGATGILATKDRGAAFAPDVDAVVYCATGDSRPAEALTDVMDCLRAGRNVVTTSLYALQHPATAPPELAEKIAEACSQGGSSIFVSGVDPGWLIDILPLLLSGVVADIEEIRCRELFNYALYDQPDVVRNVVGMGLSMDKLPPMLQEFSLRFVWEPNLRVLAEGLGASLDEIRTTVERRPLEADVDVPGMGRFEAGTQGAFRFEVEGLIEGTPRLVVEHVTRIDDACAPDWPYPENGSGAHGVRIKGRPNLELFFHADDPLESGPGAGGNATAAARIVNAIPGVCGAAPGIRTALDLAPVTGVGQARWGARDPRPSSLR